MKPQLLTPEQLQELLAKAPADYSIPDPMLKDLIKKHTED